MKLPFFSRLRWHLPRYFFMVWLASMLLPALACGFAQTAPNAESGRVVIKKLLPILTPTTAINQAVPTESTPPAVSAATPSQLEQQNQPVTAAVPVQPATSAAVPVSVSPTPAPPPPPMALDASLAAQPGMPALSDAADVPVIPIKAAIVIPTATPVKGPAGWSFMNIAVYPDDFEDGLVLYGQAVNETGAPQELSFITGVFYDDQGQIIADAGSAIDYWPIDVVPPGGKLPFELSVPGLEAVDRFDLTLDAQPHAQSPRQDFEVLNVTEQQDGSGYCLAGQVRNPAAAPQLYLVVLAVLYDSQDHIINFGEYYAADPALITGEQLADFNLCIQSVSRRVARYDIRVWGE